MVPHCTGCEARVLLDHEKRRAAKCETRTPGPRHGWYGEDANFNNRGADVRKRSDSVVYRAIPRGVGSRKIPESAMRNVRTLLHPNMDGTHVAQVAMLRGIPQGRSQKLCSGARDFGVEDEMSGGWTSADARCAVVFHTCFILMTSRLEKCGLRVAALPWRPGLVLAGCVRLRPCQKALEGCSSGPAR